jgi:hypothetical protein
MEVAGERVDALVEALPRILVAESLGDVGVTPEREDSAIQHE